MNRKDTRGKGDNSKQRRCLCITQLIHLFFILVLGCATLGLGILMLGIKADFGAGHVTTIVGNQLYEVATYLLVAGGGAAAVTALCGVYGTIRENKYVLLFYGAMLALLLVVFSATTAVALLFRGKFQTGSQVNIRMQDMLTENYGVNLRTNPANLQITSAWDSMQSKLGCCGISGNGSTYMSWAFYSSNSLWYLEVMKSGDVTMSKVPKSCCRPGDVRVCTGNVYFPGPPNHLNTPRKKFNTANPYLYITGCYDKLLPYINWYALATGIASVIMLLFLIFGIILLCVFYSRRTGGSSDN